MTPELVDLIIVALIGGVVGAGELIARYRDAPWKALRCPAAVVYLVLNLGAAVAAYELTVAFGWEFGMAPGSEELRWTRVLAAGFGAMALFRSSLFVVRVGSQDLGVGPSTLLTILLAAADREVDRQRGRARAEEVRSLLSGVPWQKARADLPALCLGLVQNASLEEQNELAGAIRDLEDGDLDDEIRVYLVGLELLNFSGIGVLRGAVSLLSGAGSPPPAMEAVSSPPLHSDGV